MPPPKDDNIETLRARWKHLYAAHLPALALARDPAQPHWPVHLDHCFARIILDNAIGIDKPWNQVIKSPAVRTMTAEQLGCALELGEKVAGGEVDLVELNEVSLGLRGKKGRGGKGVRKGSEVRVGGKRKVAADSSISKYFAVQSGEEAAELKRDDSHSQKRVKLEEGTQEEEEEKPSNHTSPTNDNNNNDADNPTTTNTNPETNNMAAQIARIASSSITPFRKQTLTLLCRIPRGQWSTYQAMSDHITATSHKTCARAVGNAMRNNPFAPDVPCHRILSSDGSIGGFGGHWGAEGKFAGEKRELLREEGVLFDSKGKVKGQPFRDFGG
jgi:O-6-methylguanine DNA methyltransferase